jgi:multimeric flavodoxin WrbA
MPPATRHRPRIVILNAALNGAAGNTAAALAHLAALLAPSARLTTLTLVSSPGTAAPNDFATLRPTLAAADAFIFGTGTHWDSWSSHLQRFLESATPTEGTPLWLGKPAACVVTEHSVGGKAVLSRLQGVLVTLGCLIPPMSGLVLSRAALAAAAHDEATASDCWSADDLAVVAHNLLAAAQRRRPEWRTWPVDRGDLTARWL